MAWASGTQPQVGTPPQAVTLTAEIGTTDEGGTVSLLAPTELHGATVTEVLPAGNTDIDEGEVILVVEGAPDDVDVDGAPPTQVRVASPSAGTLDTRAVAGDELNAGDLLATITPPAVAAIDHDPGPDVTTSDGTQEAPPSSEQTPADVHEGEDVDEDADAVQSGEESESDVDRSAEQPHSAQAGRPAPAEIAPLAAGESTIVVQKGSYRSGATNPSGVSTADTVGVRFGLFDSATSTDPLYTCEISTTDGKCTFTGVAESNRTLWVGELNPAPASAAASTFTGPLTQFSTGTPNAFTDRALSLRDAQADSHGPDLHRPHRPEPGEWQRMG